MTQISKKNIVLVGNPNTGKSTLFNLFTGLNQKIGNFPGVTVDKKTGEPITPNAKEIHVGFFKSTMGPKDIELRIYSSHQEALDFGVNPAEKTINAAVEAGGAVKGAGTFAKSSYGAYIVSGNTIMLCQVQIEVCDELAEGLK